MKVQIFVYGEGDYEADTLESRMVDVRLDQLKNEFEVNGVKVELTKTDDPISGGQA